MTNKNFSKKNFYFRGFLFCGALTVIAASLLNSESIRAQISGLYDQKNDDVAGVSALMSAVTSNDITGVRFFTKAGRELVNQKNIGGATALHIACREKNFEIAKLLIESGADVNVFDNEGWTPLMRAALSGDKNIIDLLLMKGAHADEINSSGESAIIHAALSDCTDCLSLMFEKFNFIKSMNIGSLQSQLTDSFVVARNRDNQPMQVVIEAYLDRVIKMASLVQNMKNESGGSSQIFKLTSSDAPSNKVAKALPMLAKNNPSTSAVTTKFKFVSGADNQEIKVGNKFSIKKSAEPLTSETSKDIIKKNYKFLGQVKTTAAIGSSATVAQVTKPNISDEENGKMTIYLVKKSAADKVADISKPAVMPLDKKSIPVSGSVFKFNQGEAGKVVENKAREKAVKASNKNLKKPLQQKSLIEQKDTQSVESDQQQPVAKPVDNDKSIVIDLSNPVK